MSMHIRTDKGRTAPMRRRDGDPVTCERCTAPVDLLTALPRRTDHSAYRIFACTACSFLQWIPD